MPRWATNRPCPSRDLPEPRPDPHAPWAARSEVFSKLGVRSGGSWRRNSSAPVHAWAQCESSVTISAARARGTRSRSLLALSPSARTGRTATPAREGFVLEQADRLSGLQDGRGRNRVDRRLVERHPAVPRAPTIDTQHAGASRTRITLPNQGRCCVNRAYGVTTTCLASAM